MSSKLTVICYIILCLEAGIFLTLLPWVHPFGLSDWGDNYFLLYASQKIGLQGLQHAVSSGWVRGAVTGLGLLNLAMAFWEMAHFRSTVSAFQAQADHARTASAATGATAATVEAATAARATSDADIERALAPTTDAPAASSDVSQASKTERLPDYERRDDARDHAGE